MSDTSGVVAWEGSPIAAWQAAWQVPAVELRATTTSTNDIALRLAALDAPAGTTVIADRQTHGRGREGRRWHDAPAASLLLSIVLRADHDADPSVMPLRVGLAVARAIQTASGIVASIKWPNDLLAPDGRKLGGILCEGATRTGRSWLVAGIGINVTQHTDDFDPGLRDTAASLLMLGSRTSRATLAGLILDELRPFRIQPPPLENDILRQIDSRDSLRGHNVTVDGRPAGTADGIEPDGALRLRRPDTITRIRSGTVRLADTLRADTSTGRSDNAKTRSSATP